VIRSVALVDVRATRFAQGFTSALVGAVIASGAWPWLALPAVHLVASLIAGKRGNLALRFFDAVLRKRLGPGELEDARPPRFANLVGASFLLASMGSHALGLSWLGWGSAVAVAALAGLSAATGFCLACRVYGLYRRVVPLLDHPADAEAFVAVASEVRLAPKPRRP